MYKNCMDCDHAIVCTHWGDIKCLQKKVRILDSQEANTCIFYKKTLDKIDEIKKTCHCEGCLDTLETDI